MDRCKNIKKIVIYAHDTFGLGHVNRIICIANFLAENKNNRILVITGSKGLGVFNFHKSVDFIKVPSIKGNPIKKEHAGYTAEIGFDCDQEIFELRKIIINNVITTFKPNIFIVDHSPLGANKELIDILYYLRNNFGDKIKIFLGQRDIYYEQVRYRKNWKKNNLENVFNDLYDNIFIYGQKELFDYLTYYDIPKKLWNKFKYLGYIVDARDAKRKKISENKIITVLVGGGRDGRELIERCLYVYPIIKEKLGVDMLINLGPLMETQDCAALKEKITKLSGVMLKEFIYNTRQYINSSDLVISMGGYNSVCEILTTDTPAIIYPRCINDQEQLLRAKIMSKKGLLDFVYPKKYTEKLLIKKITHLLKIDRKELAEKRKKIKFDGLKNLNKYVNT